MSKITAVSNGDTGLAARTKINTALETVETDSTISGDGNVGTELVVVPSAVDHNTLLNYVATEHIDWTGSSSDFSTSGSNNSTEYLLDGKSIFPENVVIINSLADFAVQDATTITLEDGKTYIPGAPISTSKRWVVGAKVSITGTDPRSNVWEYTGTGIMFTGVDVEIFSMSNFGFLATNCTEVFNISDTVPGTSSVTLSFVIGVSTSAVLIAEKFGTFTDIARIFMERSGTVDGLGVNQGIELVGTLTSIVLDVFSLFSASATFIHIDFGTAVLSQLISLINCVSIGSTPGSIGISGLTASGNIAAGSSAIVQDHRFVGALTPLSGISESDLRWEIQDSSPVPNSSKTADTFLTVSRTVLISTPGDFVAIAGTDWGSDVLERFTVTTSGLLTYVGVTSTKAQVAITATVEKVGGGTDEIELAVSINGTESLKTVSATENNTPTSVTSIGLFTIDTGNTIQAFVSNIDSDSDIIVSRCTVNVINGF